MPAASFPGPTAWAPGGNHSVSSSATGHGWSSTIAAPFHGKPTPAADSTTVFAPTRAIRVTFEAAEDNKFRSGGNREFSK